MQNRREIIRALFEEYSDDVYRYVSYSLPRNVDPWDVVQEVFLRAFQSWERFEHKSSAKTWLFTIARNYVYDLHRMQKAEANRFEALIHSSSPQVTHLGTTIEYDDLLHQIPESYRQVFLLRAVEGFNAKETARILGWNEGNVRLTFFRAKKKLMKLLTDVESDLRKRGEPQT